MKKLLSLSVILFVFLFSSCSSSGSANDSDAVSDADRERQDSETLVDEDADKDADPVEDSDKTPDVDQDNDSDTSETVECLDLRYNENTIKTPFPFKDENGKITFCRPGCDTPTENDPQCVRNIWEWDNWEEYQVYLEAQEKDPNQDGERECYPWPCKLPDMHPKTKETLDTFVSACDRLLTVHNFKANSGTVNTHGMFDGAAGMDFSHTGRIVEYDPEKDEYMTIGQNKTMLAFNENRYVTLIHESDPPENAKFKSFVISVFRENGSYYYEFIYDNKNHNSFFSRPALAGKNWVLIHVKEGDSSSVTEIKYASSKDWKWHKLDGINNYAGEGNIVGDHLTFITNNRELYYCDLRKYP
ncbi:hypothetical protein J5834_01975, partial [bacterium]|nr:hypothetical protein [bacterium]